jgi:hypothetical protein
MTWEVIDLRTSACDGEAMAELLAWSGRIYAAAALALLGAGLVVLAIRSLRSAGRQRRSWPEWALTYLYVFRASVVGVCLVGAGLAWLAQVPWLLAAAVCIAVGEFLESSYYIVVLQWGDRRSRQAQRLS